MWLPSIRLILSSGAVISERGEYNEVRDL
jgi:hypothetical protein